MKIELPALEQIQKAFLDAMAYGYADPGCRPMTPIGPPGLRETIWQAGPWRAIDRWVTNNISDYSDGMTVIWFQGQAIWTMHYGGWYKKKVIQYLKKALFQAYVVDRQFVGGRGPEEMRVSRRSRLRYQNLVVGGSSFASFQGVESIVDDKGKSFGTHWYRGGLLIPSGLLVES